MRIVITVIALFIVNAASGQSKFKFHSQNYIGIVGGESDAALQFQTINGLQRRTWFAGLGTGLDYYYQRTVPLFLSFTKYLNNGKNSPYFSLDGGTNFILDKTTGNFFNGYRNDGNFSPSLYYGAHLGYKMGLNTGKNSVLMALGYSAKRLREELKSQYQCPNPPCPEYDEKYDYRLNRFSFKLGWMF